MISAIVLLAAGLIAHQIDRMLLPQVNAVEVNGGMLSTSSNFTGTQQYSGTAGVSAGSSWQIHSVSCAVGDTVEQGTPLFTVDAVKQELAVREAEQSLQQLEGQIEMTSDAAQKEILTLRKKLAEKDLEALSAGLPENGVVKAPAAGEIVSLCAVPGRMANAGEVLCEIKTADSKQVITFTASYETGYLYDIGTAVTANAQINSFSGAQQKLVGAQITGKNLSEDGTWRFAAEVPETEGKLLANVSVNLSVTESRGRMVF